MLKNIPIIFLSKLLNLFIKLFSFGSGSTWPGEIALRLNNYIIVDILKISPLKLILVSGTNGKTTTVALLKKILKDSGKKVISNEEGANLINGIASCLIKNMSITGKLNYQYGIFEVDENTLPIALRFFTPEAVLILNLFRDQLDRYGEVNIIAKKWSKALQTLPPQVKIFLNADDPQIKYLGENLKAEVFYFGVEKKLMKKTKLSHDVDSNYCPNCNSKLDYKLISYSHLGDYQCRNCVFKRGYPMTLKAKNLRTKVKGLFNNYNITAAFLVSKILLSLTDKDIKKSINNFLPAFGRQEVIEVRKRKVFILLSKNPAGFNQSIEVVKEIFSKEKSNVLLVLNDRIPDGRDISWIWDVDFDRFKEVINYFYVSGDRAYDLALRICYEGIPKEKIKVYQGNIKKALFQIINNTAEKKKLIILANYSAMLEVRKVLVGKKFL